MTAHRMHLTAEWLCLLAIPLLTVVLVATACGAGVATHAAVPDARGVAPRGMPQDALSDRSDSAAAPTARGLDVAPVADVETVTYSVGQTAAVGDLLVTVDKVAVTAREAGNLPQAGKRFLFVYITVENTGKAAQSLNYLATSVTDTAGRRYFVEA
jgi:Domain of unknown function (DUF4352)